MRALVIVVAAIVLFALAAIALAPATLVAPRLAALTSDRFALADVDGTIWNGRATIVGDDGKRIPIAWTAERAALARGELRLHLTPPAGTQAPRGDIDVSDGAIRARAVYAVVPASWLVSTLSTLPVNVGGDVAIDAPTLDWSRASSSGGAHVEWRDARVAVPGAADVDLGTVTSTLTAIGDRFTGPIRNSGGEVAVDGTVTAFADGGGETNLLLTPRRSDDALARMLSALGGAEGGGYRVRARWQGR